MKITWYDLIVEPSEHEMNGLFQAWEWLIGKDYIPLTITSMGDAFLQKEDGKIYWLNVGEGKFTKISEDLDEFNKQLTVEELVNEWFLVELLHQLKVSGYKLKPDQLFGYKQIPIMGGKYEPDNFEPILVSIHFHLNGQIHEQVKDLPNGTKVNIKTKH